MDDLFSHPYFTPLIIGVAATIIGTLIIALTNKSWTKTKHLPSHLANRILTLAREFDYPVLLIITKSKLNALMTVSVEYDALQLLNRDQKQQIKELSDQLQTNEGTIEIQETLLQRISHNQDRAVKALESAMEERDRLRQQNEQLKNMIETLKHSENKTITGKTGSRCQIPGRYISLHDLDLTAVNLNTGEVFPPASSLSTGDLKHSTWILIKQS